jgi:hypothetical protein
MAFCFETWYAARPSYVTSSWWLARKQHTKHRHFGHIFPVAHICVNKMGSLLLNFVDPKASVSI